MIHFLFQYLALSTLLLSSANLAFADISDEMSKQAVFEEELQSLIRAELRLNSSDLNSFVHVQSENNCEEIRCLTLEDNIVAALADLLEENPRRNAGPVLTKIKEVRAAQKFSLDGDLQLYALGYQAYHAGKVQFSRSERNQYLSYERWWRQELIESVTARLNENALTEKSFLIISGDPAFKVSTWKKARALVMASRPAPSPQPTPTVSDAFNLVHNKTNRHLYDEGRFKNAPQLFMFCRQSRLYPCLFVVKDKNGNLMKDDSGKVWAQPSLALSSRRLAYNQTNGQTPQGVYRLDGVMPEANRPVDFGKFRRVILNFIGKSETEKTLKLLLPDAHHNLSWWNESVVARDIGRNSLRIHGTGRRSLEGTSYHPFVATAGCIAQRENTYGDTEFLDQRKILDQLMKAQGLNPVFENEAKIKALLYVYDLDDKKSAVTVSDLKAAKVL